MSATTELPLVLAGPILRKLTRESVTLWLVTTQDVRVKINLSSPTRKSEEYLLARNSTQHITIGYAPSLYYQLIHLNLSQPLEMDCLIDYRLMLRPEGDETGGWQNITELMPELLYPGQSSLKLCLPSRVGSLLHGSCRKPHFAGVDGVVEADRHLEHVLSNQQTQTSDWPSMIVMSGDQIYADDVAGPMLSAIHQLSAKLKFPCESWQVAPDSDERMTSEALYQHSACYYRREHLLPCNEEGQMLVKTLFGGARKPIFTSSSADNHLITLGEYLACYLLSWSAVPWQLVDKNYHPSLSPQLAQRYQQELSVINQFIQGLTQVQRVMAHLPVAMILDDHDITDDFNLHRSWEETVYNHPLSHRMVGNGMLAYLINQAWGNSPQTFSPQLIARVKQALEQPGAEDYPQLLDTLIKLEAWDFEWPTDPPLIVLDTRTRRWRSESSATKPSGLLDWEALTELQGRLSGHSSVLLVSAAPIFGVKLIEVIQRLATIVGQPLAVDAEYWMAHPGTASGILNVFCHRKTPQNFVVLSGDVHYSFVYDVELRGRRNSPEIWQICSSGLRNNFPEPLLSILDKLNRWLYSPRSPLNWFTRRRRMRITPRKPLGTPKGQRLLNHSGVGLVELDQEGRPTKISQLVGAQTQVEFESREEEANWH
ncbi:alkaline phosphatase family protein [Vibrio sp. WXL210]|uniref:alkaline phosphatase family protein n=1 Tax=Vibrio sp. WXL210 TaxID=3450709 RepID=UPI003EC7A65C